LSSISTILHATDLSDLSLAAFQFAAALARDHGAGLIVLHVVPQSPHHSESSAQDRADTYVKMMAQVLDRIGMAEWASRVQSRTVKGNAADEIVRVARENNVDLIVLGTHGRTGIRRAVMGSVAEKVLRLAPCPVLAVNSSVAMIEAACRQTCASMHGVCRPCLADVGTDNSFDQCLSHANG
jgi:nucleotide-binding universal stress UspA family protein